MNGKVHLGDIADVFNGKTPSKAEQRDHGHPVLKVRDVDEHGRHRGATLSFVDHDLAAKYQRKWVKAGDTLILNAAHNADYVASKTYFAGDEAAGLLATGEWLLVRPRADVANAAYLNFWLRSGQARDSIRFLVKGIHLYPKDVAGLELVLPALAEQRRIADLLSRAEGIVRLRRQAQQKAAALIPAIFVNMFGDPTTNPREWPTKPLRDLVEFQSGGTPSKARDDYWQGDVPWVSPKDMKRMALYDAIDHVNSLVLSETSLKLVPRESVLIVVRGMILAHTVPVAEARVPLTVNQDIKAMVSKGEINSTYLLRMLQVCHDRLLAQVTTAAHGTKKLDTERLAEMVIPVPPMALQQAFDSSVRRVEAIQEHQVNAMAKAEASFSALLARAFSVQGTADTIHETESALA